MPKIGMIVRMDKSGLGAQTKRLARIINPDRVMLINSTPFNASKQYPDWYYAYEVLPILGFPTENEIVRFLGLVDIVISCETFYNNSFVEIARDQHVKTINIFNYEFLDNLLHPAWPLPDKLIQPSQWHLEETELSLGAEYLPTPIFHDEFTGARETNLKRQGKPRYLFLNGKSAAHDRAGLQSLYEALQLSKGDFEVVVKSQSDIPRHPDPRLSYDFSDPEDQAELYTDFDALLHPRRYGGQSLPMCEALMSGLPVIMTDIDPNNKILPAEWLVPAQKTGQFMTRTMIDIYAAYPQALAERLDAFHIDIHSKKEQAIGLSQQYQAENLRSKYEELVNA